MNDLIKAIPWIGSFLAMLLADAMKVGGDDSTFFVVLAICIGIGVGLHHLSPLIWLALAPMHENFADFSAVAEQEVEDYEYDDGLWSVALVKCHGDEAKRKITYMKLRATQLIREQYDEA